MNNKTCGECRFLIPEYDRHGRGKCYCTDNRYLPSCGACKAFAERYGGNSPTVFDTIAVSPEVLAERSVYCLSSDLRRTNDGKFIVKRNWTSPFIDRCYGTRDDAFAATVARLQEVAK